MRVADLIPALSETCVRGGRMEKARPLFCNSKSVAAVTFQGRIIITGATQVLFIANSVAADAHIQHGSVHMRARDVHACMHACAHACAANAKSTPAGPAAQLQCRPAVSAHNHSRGRRRRQTASCASVTPPVTCLLLRLPAATVQPAKRVLQAASCKQPAARTSSVALLLTPTCCSPHHHARPSAHSQQPEPPPAGRVRALCVLQHLQPIAPAILGARGQAARRAAAAETPHL